MLPGILTLKTIVQQYASLHPNEQVDKISSFLDGCKEHDELYNRKNFNGHVTTSALIFDTQRRCLMVLHAVFNRWLPPGGHVEPGDNSLVQSAIRESNEETGVKKEDLIYLPLRHDSAEVPFDLNSHLIPPHPQKHEPPHWHHDFRFLFRYTGNGILTPDEEETKGAEWIPADSLDHVPDMIAVFKKINLLKRAE